MYLSLLSFALSLSVICYHCLSWMCALYVYLCGAVAVRCRFEATESQFLQTTWENKTNNIIHTGECWMLSQWKNGIFWWNFAISSKVRWVSREMHARLQDFTSQREFAHLDFSTNGPNFTVFEMLKRLKILLLAYRPSKSIYVKVRLVFDRVGDFNICSCTIIKWVEIVNSFVLSIAYSFPCTHCTYTYRHTHTHFVERTKLLFSESVGWQNSICLVYVR